MSIKVLKVREPRLDIDADRTYVAMIGGSNVTTKSYTSDTASNQQIIWSITTPSVRVGMDRRMDIEFSCNVSCLNNVGAAAPLLAVPTPTSWSDVVNAGLRQFPLHSIIEVVNVRLNDQALSYEPSQLIHALTEYGNDEEDRQYFMGSTPHKPDISPDYGLVAANVGNRNPFISYWNAGSEDARGLRFWTTQVDANTFQLKIVESLMMSPFYWGKTDHQALFGIQNVDVTLTLTNIKKVLAGALAGLVGTPASVFPTGVNVNSLQVNVNPDSSQKMHLTFITPQPDQVPPRLLHYPYYQIKRWSQNALPYVGGEVRTENYNNITLHEIPKRFYIFAKPTQNNDPTVADYFLAIDRVVINFDNQDKFLS